jgi:uncharacterized protein (TIGR00661 family)
MRKIAYYITAHGYGHGTRSCDILNALHDQAPDTPILVKTDLPHDFMRSRLPPEIEIISGALDVGLIQKDSIQVDLDASFSAVEEFYKTEEYLIQQEVNFIRKNHIGIVIADLPAIPLTAAKQTSIPAIAVGNFGWDWIYEDLVKYNPLWKIYIEKIRSVYRQTDLLIRIPFAEPMAAFPNRIDVPLLAKPGQSNRKRITELTHADTHKKWILLSFTSLNLNHLALEKITELTDYEFFSVEPLAWEDSAIHCINRNHISFSDLLASIDIVITKPGFGIVSECIANQKPILYADRENFPEYAVLVENIERYCCHSFIATSELYTGQLERALSTLKNATPAKEEMKKGGAALAASEIIKRIG